MGWNKKKIEKHSLKIPINLFRKKKIPINAYEEKNVTFKTNMKLEFEPYHQHKKKNTQ